MSHGEKFQAWAAEDDRIMKELKAQVKASG